MPRHYGIPDAERLAISRSIETREIERWSGDKAVWRIVGAALVFWTIAGLLVWWLS